MSSIQPMKALTRYIVSKAKSGGAKREQASQKSAMSKTKRLRIARPKKG